MHGTFDKHGYAKKQDATAAAPITFPAATFKQRDQWSRKVPKIPGMKLMHKNVLRSLALCARTDRDGRFVIDPTYDELADAAGCCRRTAIYAIEVAEEIGIVRKARHSDGRVSNRFDLLLPNTAANGDKNAENPQEKTKEIQRPTVHGFSGAEGSNGASACTV
jgi:hypothetical protein